MNILCVGSQVYSTQAAPFSPKLRITRHCAKDGETARHFLSRMRADVLLIARQLSDGSGLHFATTLSGLPVNAFVSLIVEDGCLWLPVLDGGELCIGAPVLRPSELAEAIEILARGKRTPHSIASRKDAELEWLFFLASAHWYRTGE